ncbi:MAG: hypothetical protein RLZZ553_1402 [Verrucomicrobiota bacterium]
MSIQPPSFINHSLHEEGLWNLDEDWNANRKAVDETSKNITPVEVVTIPEIPLPEKAASPDFVPVQDEIEDLTRIETKYDRRRLTRNKRPEDREDHENNSESSLKKNAASSPEKSSHLYEAQQPRSAPVGIGLTEDEVWADFLIEEEPLTQKESPRPSIEMPAVEAVEEMKPAPVFEEVKPTESPNTPPAPDPEAAQPLQSENSQSHQSKQDPPEGENAPAEEVISSHAPAVTERPRLLPKLSRFEIVTSLIFLTCMAVAGLWSLQVFRKEVQAQPNPYLLPDLPASGNWANVSSISTFWRAPVTEGANADTVRQDVIKIPVIRIKLGQGRSSSGAIRVIFYNDKGIIAGDTVTQRIESHVFTENGTSEINFSATTGFTNFGDQEAYRAHLVKPWTVRVFEGPGENAPSSEYRYLFTTPVSTSIQ